MHKSAPLLTLPELVVSQLSRQALIIAKQRNCARSRLASQSNKSSIHQKHTIPLSGLNEIPSYKIFKSVERRLRPMVECSEDVACDPKATKKSSIQAFIKRQNFSSIIKLIFRRRQITLSSKNEDIVRESRPSQTDLSSDVEIS